jgi:hypothetical protein
MDICMHNSLNAMAEARVIAAAALAKSKSVEVHHTDIEVEDFTRLSNDYVVRLSHPDYPYLQIWVQKRDTRFDTRIWVVEDRYTSSTLQSALF